MFFLFISLSIQAFAMGGADKTDNEKKTQNDDWILCITNFDISSLPADKVGIAGIITRKMAERLSAINYRTRISPEYAYYEEYAWARERTAAARALSVKMDERSQQIYRGEPEWRYRQNLARIDADIERLREAFEEIENNPPLINREPVFSLTRGNLELVFPAAPASGSEFRFCSDQRADAFLSGSIIDFHGRYFLSMKLYAVYTRSFIWEDSIIFSHDDLENALDEITRRLLVTLSGNQSAAVAIRAEPEETLLLINRSFAGRGETDVLEYPPGQITITASAPNYESITLETELFPGELLGINLRLNPVRYGYVEITGDKEGSVYQGALFVGETPLTLRLPLNQTEYIELETPDSYKGTMVFQTPGIIDFLEFLPIDTEPLPQKGVVNRMRNNFYWAWGGVWVSIIATWITYYTYMGMDFAIRYDYSQGNVNQNFYNQYNLMPYLFGGTIVALSAVSIYGVYQLVKYLYTANKGFTSVRSARRN